MEGAPECYVGDDMLFEILSWMPAKCVIKNSSFVSKTLIYERPFIKNQSINSSQLDGGFFLQTSTYNNLNLFVLPSQSPTVFGIPEDSIAFFQNKARVLASTQGLILIREADGFESHRFSVCNPVTKTCAPIPLPENIENLLDFGNDNFIITCNPRNCNDFPYDFTVVAPMFVEVDDGAWGADFRLAMYRNGEWDAETIDLKTPPCRQLCLDNPVGVYSGNNKDLVVHYLCEGLPHIDRNPTYSEPYVTAYDMEKKVLWTTMKLPEGAWIEDYDHLKLWILKWGKSEAIGIVRTDWRNITLWKLESYYPVEWRKVVDVTLTGLGVDEEDEGVAGCCVVNDNGLLFATWKRVYLYEMQGVNVGRLEVVGNLGSQELSSRILKFTPYANTLRPVYGQEISLLETWMGRRRCCSVESCWCKDTPQVEECDRTI